MNKVFVIMPFGKGFDDIYEKIYERIGLHLALSILYKSYNDAKLAGNHAMLSIEKYTFTKAEKTLIKHYRIS